jgi:DNA-binding MarR family transcriptional regulator
MTETVETTPERLSGLASWLLGQAALRSHGILASAFAAAGSRGYHYRLLASLSEFGAASQVDLGRSVGMDRSDVAIAISELAALDAVKREGDPVDRRRNLVRLTPRGQLLLESLDSVIAEVQRELLIDLDASERAQLIRLLSKLQPR